MKPETVAVIAAVATVAGGISITVSAPAEASPVPYVNGPIDVPNVMVNKAISNVNAAIGDAGTMCFASGNVSGNVTCNSTRTGISVTNLTTGNQAVSAAITVNDSAATAASQITCTANGYAGTGTPIPVLVTPGAGNFTMAVENLGGGSLNATVPVNCTVQN